MLKPCWEIKKCGREEGGLFAESHGVCPAYPNHGHSCFTVAGTFCTSEVTGTSAKRINFCTKCDVFRAYDTEIGTMREAFRKQSPEEFAACEAKMLHRDLVPLYRFLSMKPRDL